ncbi:hypothetical protein AKJ08_2227 [Vulgatibacter incomptus]|uniref:Uncharacterized protein n=1 Tax=Vulgatibacter incomptus TaxID=1391653 RepID=A0A0K1PE95_9BACT|nr:hypothetical protein AKJ08_2227 [Vulgatibacter incomptus]
MEFPKELRPSEVERVARRRTLPPPVAPEAKADRKPEPQRDPLLAALSSAPGASNVVLEVNALRHSPLGELFVGCLAAEHGEELKRLQDELGIDPLEDVDRFALGGETVMISGHFANAKWDKIAGDSESKPIGERGRLFTKGDEAVAIWNDELVIAGKSVEAVQETIDRVEGRSESPPALDESLTYGEIYGQLSVESMTKLLGTDQPELAERLREAAERIELHVDATGDVAISADVRGGSGQALDDLARSMSGAISLARIQSKVRGDAELSQLLDLANVARKDGRFTIELALPLALLQKHLADCGRSPGTASESADDHPY